MKAEDRVFLDSIKGKVNSCVYDLLNAYYSLSPKAQAFLSPYIEEMNRDNANIDEIIERATADWLKVKTKKGATA